MWKVPLFDVKFGSEESLAVSDVLESGWLTMGDVTAQFEKEFAAFIGVKHAIAVSSCTAGLHLVLRALKVGTGDEVICPALTFVAGPNSVLYAGAKPVFADIKGADELNLDPADVARKITPKTRVIQVLHYGGFPCDLESILEIAEKRGIPVIEDCAHAPGARIGSRMCGALGAAGVFSFFSNKNITTGEGGMVTTNDDTIARTVKLMRSHGMTTLTLDRHRGHAFNYDVVELGYNYRIDEIRSAIGLVQLKKLSSHNAQRAGIVDRYRRCLRKVDGVHIPFLDRADGSAHHLFPLVLADAAVRNLFMEHMKSRGIQTSIHYPAAHLFDYYRRTVGTVAGSLPETEKVTAHEVTLPLYPTMKDADVDSVCDAVSEFFAKEKVL